MREFWREIRSHTSLEGDFRDEVLAVADAAMRRVARNTDMLAERLHARGWRPLTPEACGLRSPPSADNDEIFSRIEEVSGAPVPPTLLAFWKNVGGINFVWDYESGKRAPDLSMRR